MGAKEQEATKMGAQVVANSLATKDHMLLLFA